MNEQNTIKELLDQLHNSRSIIEKINAAYLGCAPDDVEITVKRSQAS